MGNPPTSLTGAGRSACPQEGAGNLSERFVAKRTRHAQWYERFLAKRTRHAQWYERFLAKINQ
jgi:hypothetical protein